MSLRHKDETVTETLMLPGKAVRDWGFDLVRKVSQGALAIVFLSEIPVDREIWRGTAYRTIKG